MGGLCQRHMHMAPQVSTQEYPQLNFCHSQGLTCYKITCYTRCGMMLHMYVPYGDIHVHVHT